jgi:hypothetical protein
METNPVYAIKFLTRMRLAALKKRTGKNKSQPSRRMLGADPWVCKKFIEDQFADGMSWLNRGDWHIDHFFPIRLARNNCEVKIFSHFTNLRPLWSGENLKKSASSPTPAQMIERNNWIEKWINENLCFSRCKMLKSEESELSQHKWVGQQHKECNKDNL